MHPNPVFHTATRDQNIAFARDRGFGVLAIANGDAPLVAHVPFLVDEKGEWIELHLVRSNPIARALSRPTSAVIAASGPDSYVSPDWYGTDDQVPTWNYVAVHLRGDLELLPQEDLPGVLDRLSANFEDRLLPKQPWTADKMTPSALEKLMRQIVPCRMRVSDVDGTWKLNQNKPDEVRLSAADHIAGYGIGQEIGLLSALMRGA